MLEKEIRQRLKESGYTYKEIERISKSLESIEEWEIIAFEDVINQISTKEQSHV